MAQFQNCSYPGDHGHPLTRKIFDLFLENDRELRWYAIHNCKDSGYIFAEMYYLNSTYTLFVHLINNKIEIINNTLSYWGTGGGLSFISGSV